MKKNLLISVLLLLSTLLMLIDFLHTYSQGEIGRLLESNPLYLVGGWLLPIAANIIVFIIIYFMYTRARIGYRFFAITFLVWMFAYRCLAIYNNMQIAANPPTIEEARAVTESMKVSYSFVSGTIYMLIPMIISLISYWLFSIDHIITKRGDKNG